MKTKNIILGNLECRQLTSEAQTIVTAEIQAKYFELKKKYNHSFHFSKKENLAFMFKTCLDKVRGLPASDPIRYKMELTGTWETFGETANSVIEAMELLGLLPDYQYLESWDFHGLQMFIWKLENNHGIKDITASDLLNCTDFGKLFSAYLRGNVDPTATKYSDEIKKAADGLFSGMSFEAKSDLLAKISAYVFSPGMDADGLHNLIFS
jgi:hypothetical protein